MSLTVSVIHSFSVVFALFLAPLLFLSSWLYRKQFRNVIFEWKKPETSVMTIIIFAFNLALFIGACFLFAGSLGRAKFSIIELPVAIQKTLCLDALLLFGGLTLIYLAIQNFYIQHICRDGIALERWQWNRLTLHVELIRWEEIRDYYMQSDYPVTHFHFLVSLPNLTFGKKSLKVPFYALGSFETLLELNLKKQREARQRSRQTLASDPDTGEMFLEEDFND